jgi:alpha-L-rhamnosidase
MTLAAPLQAGGIAPSDLRCEYHEAPLAIATNHPRFSWKLKATTEDARDLVQSAYEIQAARESDGFGKPPLWSTGKVAGRATSQIEWSAGQLQSRDRIAWRVRVWDGGNKASDWSAPATFGVGLLNPEDWTALWISSKDDHAFTTSENVRNFADDPERGALHLTPAKYFRKEFETSPVVRATLHATALGVYTVEINGKRVSDERLAPGWSAYQKRIHSQTYDVTGLVREGNNAIGATLADGWYSGYVAYGLLTGRRGTSRASTADIIMAYHQPSGPARTRTGRRRPRDHHHRHRPGKPRSAPSPRPTS